ncbi:hypothetical protein ANANG_G00080650 [Anguilla anguilla]|uniref:Uncharacterized protein n=1 Tax=Anguilla anguilla TaxID=7936 RepID=A0A9D3S0N6_ANGAN|nr:hypothetical protein ANANG_G00080650 [Anguilla anguilla]
MVQNSMLKTPSTSQEIHMDTLENPSIQSRGKGARRKGGFKGSDGSTSSDTTSNSFVRQVRARGPGPLQQHSMLQLSLFQRRRTINEPSPSLWAMT